MFAPVVVPAIAATFYVLGSLGMKRSMQAGATHGRVLLVSNLILALWALPLIFIFPGKWDALGAFGAVLAGASLFIGRIFSVRALELGDLSIVVPLLALKTLFVAFASLVLGSGVITPGLLGAAALATAGVVCLQVGPPTAARNSRKAILYALASSAMFTVTDLSVQSFARLMGAGFFQPLMLLTLCLMLPLLGRQPSAPPPARKPLLLGSLIMGLQTTAVILTIGLTAQATLVNIIYSSRSIWGVIVDRLTGGLVDQRFLILRLIGAISLTSAVILAILSD